MIDFLVCVCFLKLFCMICMIDLLSGVCDDHHLVLLVPRAVFRDVWLCREDVSWKQCHGGLVKLWSW